MADPRASYQAPLTTRQEVVVTDVRMPFTSMVVFMVKWVIATIPALLILLVVMALRSCLLTPR